MSTQSYDEGSATNHEVGALPVESTMDGATDSSALHVPTPLQDTADTAVPCEETLATPDVASAADQDDDGQNDDPAKADVQPEPTVPQGTIDGPPPRNPAAVALLGDDGQDDDSEVNALEAAMDRTAQRHSDEAVADEPECSPLEGKLPPSTEFPLAALGGMLMSFALALQVLTGTPIELCAVSLIAFVNICVQGLADVQFISSKKQLGLYHLIIGSTGERKTSVTDILRIPFDRFEKRMEKTLKQLVQECGEDKNARKEEPLLPDIIFTGSTTPALYHVLQNCLGRLCMITSEAGSFIGGYSMKADNYLEQLTQMSCLFDGEPVKNYRRGDGRILVRDKRFSLLLYGQWDIVCGFLSNPKSLAQGFISRLLVSYPPSLIGSRPLVLRPSEAIATMEEYDRWMTDLLNIPLALEGDSRNDLCPPALTMTEGAEREFAVFYDKVEQMMGKFGSESSKICILNKFPQHALRLAATLQIAENPSSVVLDGEHMERGIQLADYYMSEALRLSTPPPICEHRDSVEALMNALTDKGLREFDRSWCYKHGPNHLRAKRTLMPVLDFLEGIGWLTTTSLPKRAGVAKARTIYRLTTGAMRHWSMRS